MKKVISMLAIAAFLFSVNVNAHEDPKGKEKKECGAKEKKSCSKSKKGGCCAAKKMEENK